MLGLFKRRQNKKQKKWTNGTSLFKFVLFLDFPGLIKKYNNSWIGTLFYFYFLYVLATILSFMGKNSTDNQIKLLTNYVFNKWKIWSVNNVDNLTSKVKKIQFQYAMEIIYVIYISCWCDIFFASSFYQP